MVSMLRVKFAEFTLYWKNKDNNKTMLHVNKICVAAGLKSHGTS